MKQALKRTLVIHVYHELFFGLFFSVLIHFLFSSNIINCMHLSIHMWEYIFSVEFGSICFPTFSFTKRNIRSSDCSLLSLP